MATRFDVLPAEAGTRLDVVVARRCTDLSRSRIQRLVRDGLVTVDGKPGRSSQLLAANAVVEVSIPPAAPAVPAPEALPLRVLYQDADVVVVDKPAGLVVHPGAGHASGTLVNALLHHVRDLSGIGGAIRPGIVHRLDRGTSGVMVVAKNDRSHQSLSTQFAQRDVTKIYQALVWGRPEAGRVFDAPLGRDPRHRQRISSRAHRARTAATRILEVEPFGPVSLLELSIASGRTHQIRVHLSEAGYPLVGDSLYGGDRRGAPPGGLRLDRPFLHARRLAFRHPSTDEWMSFEAPLPSDLETIVTNLRARFLDRETRADEREGLL
jgi:23S rRNA pseudouridine1911/1915/1917 synthase